MYVAANPYRPGYLFKMHERCSNCGTKFKIEPSFFYGAMYVSYAVGVGFSVIVFLISFLLIGLNLLQSFLVIVTMLVLFLPVITRLSRNIWINFFINYDKNAEVAEERLKS